MTESQTIQPQDEVTTLGPAALNRDLMKGLLHAVIWQLGGDRQCAEQSRYVYLEDAVDITSKLDFDFEDFRSEEHHADGAHFDGIKITWKPKAVISSEDLPATDEEEATEGGYDWEQALEALAPYLGDLTDKEAKAVAAILKRVV